MIRKFLITLAILVLALALVSCGGDTQPQDTTPPTDEVTEHVHVYEEDIVAPTCTTAGSKKLVCECGDVQSDEVIGILDHTPSAPDCEKDTVCTVCNTVMAPAAGHTMTDQIIVTAASCSTTGKAVSTCLTCGKRVETDIPKTGHVPAAGSTPTAVADGFTLLCGSCGQTVTLKAQAPIVNLTFEADVETEMSGNALGLVPIKPQNWAVTEMDGSKALLSEGPQKVYYVNIPSAKPFEELGTFVVSFDYMVTKVVADARASVFSVLGNFYDGKNLKTQNETKWGWAAKLIANNSAIATVNSTDTNASNSFVLKENVKYKVQIIMDANSTSKQVFVNGQYIGDAKQGIALAGTADGTMTFRFGDGPACVQVFDNFTISALK